MLLTLLKPSASVNETLVVADVSHAHNAEGATSALLIPGVGLVSPTSSAALLIPGAGIVSDEGVVLNYIPLVTLSVNDAAHTNTPDAPVLGISLLVNDAAHGHTADEPVLGVSLLVNDSAHTNTTDEPAVAQDDTDETLVVADAAHGNTTDAPTLTPILIVADATHSNATDAPTLTPILIVADATHGNATEGATSALLIPGVGLVGPTSSAALLIPGAGIVSDEGLVLDAAPPATLVVNDAAQATTTDAITLSLSLLVNDAAHGHSGEEVNIAGSVIPNDAVHAVTSEEPILGLSLLVNDAAHVQAVDEPLLSLSLLVNDAAHVNLTDAPAVAQDIEAELLVIADAAHRHSAEGATSALLIPGVGLVGPTSSAALLIPGAGIVSDEGIVLTTAMPSAIIVADSAHSQSTDSVVLTQANTLAVQDAAQAVVTDAISTSHIAVTYLLIPGVGLVGTLGPVLIPGAGLVKSSEERISLAVQDAVHSQTTDLTHLGGILAVNDAYHVHFVNDGTVTPAVEVIAYWIELVVAGPLLGDVYALHGHTTDSIDLTQANTLVVNDAYHNHYQPVRVIADDTLHAHTAEQVPFEGAEDIVVAHNSKLYQYAERVARFGIGIVSNDAAHSVTSDTPSLSLSLLVNDSAHVTTAEELTFTDFGIVAADGAHEVTSDEVELTPALIPADAAHVQTADQITLDAHDRLVVNDARHIVYTSGIALTQANTLAVNDATHSNTSETPYLGVDIDVDDSAHAQSADEVTLTPVLTVADSAHGHTTDGIALTQANTLAANDAIHANLTDAPAITVGHRLFVLDAKSFVTSDVAVIRRFIEPEKSWHWQQTNPYELELTQSNRLAVADILHGHTADQVEFGKFLVVSDAQHAVKTDRIFFFGKVFWDHDITDVSTRFGVLEQDIDFAMLDRSLALTVSDVSVRRSATVFPFQWD